MNKRMTGVLFLSFWVIGLSAQWTWERAVLATSGSTLSSGSLTLNMTLGEAVVGVLSDGTSLLTANLGFQQGSLVLTGLEEWSAPGLPDVFPNPFYQYLFIRLQQHQYGHLILYDALGQVLLRQDMSPESSNTLNLADLQAGSYILKWLDLTSGQCASLILIKQ